MASAAESNEASCESDPNFAVICAFLEKFGATCGLAAIDILELQEMLENTQEVRQNLIDLHIKLLRKTRKSVNPDRWEKAVIKFCHTFCMQDAWEIERFGYKKARLSSKIRVLKELLEIQFDYNVKFKQEINKITAPDLRSQPLGKDKQGHAYWFQDDNNCQIRVYKEDPDEETWTLVAKDRDGLVSLINELSNGDSKQSSTESTMNEEDSNSLAEKPIIDTGQVDSTSSNSDSADNTKKHPHATTNKNISDEADDDNARMGEEEEEEDNDKVKKSVIRKNPGSKKRLRESSDEDDGKKDKDKQPRKKIEVSEATEEPLMLIKGRGSGADNECPNIVGEEIVEDVMYFSGAGSGFDCQTGNESTSDKKDEKSGTPTDTTSSDVSIKSSVKNQSSQGPSKETSPVKVAYKLGTIIDTKTDNSNKLIINNNSSTTISDKVNPGTTKKSRWDVETIIAKNTDTEKVDDDKRTTSPQKMFFFGPGCLAFKPSVASIPTFGIGQNPRQEPTPDDVTCDEKVPQISKSNIGPCDDEESDVKSTSSSRKPVRESPQNKKSEKEIIASTTADIKVDTSDRDKIVAKKNNSAPHDPEEGQIKSTKQGESTTPIPKEGSEVIASTESSPEEKTELVLPEKIEVLKEPAPVKIAGISKVDQTIPKDNIKVVETVSVDKETLSVDKVTTCQPLISVESSTSSPTSEHKPKSHPKIVPNECQEVAKQAWKNPIEATPQLLKGIRMESTDTSKAADIPSTDKRKEVKEQSTPLEILDKPIKKAESESFRVSQITARSTETVEKKSEKVVTSQMAHDQPAKRKKEEYMDRTIAVDNSESKNKIEEPMETCTLPKVDQPLNITKEAKMEIRDKLEKQSTSGDQPTSLSAPPKSVTVFSGKAVETMDVPNEPVSKLTARDEENESVNIVADTSRQSSSKGVKEKNASLSSGTAQIVVEEKTEKILAEPTTSVIVDKSFTSSAPTEVGKEKPVGTDTSESEEIKSNLQTKTTIEPTTSVIVDESFASSAPTEVGKEKPVSTDTSESVEIKSNLQAKTTVESSAPKLILDKSATLPILEKTQGIPTGSSKSLQIQNKNETKITVKDSTKLEELSPPPNVIRKVEDEFSISTASSKPWQVEIKDQPKVTVEPSTAKLFSNQSLPVSPMVKATPQEKTSISTGSPKPLQIESKDEPKVTIAPATAKLILDQAPPAPPRAKAQESTSISSCSPEPLEEKRRDGTKVATKPSTPKMALNQKLTTSSAPLGEKASISISAGPSKPLQDKISDEVKVTIPPPAPKLILEQPLAPPKEKTQCPSISASFSEPLPSKSRDETKVTTEPSTLKLISDQTASPVEITDRPQHKASASTDISKSVEVKTTEPLTGSPTPLKMPMSTHPAETIKSSKEEETKVQAPSSEMAKSDDTDNDHSDMEIEEENVSRIIVSTMKPMISVIGIDKLRDVNISQIESQIVPRNLDLATAGANNERIPQVTAALVEFSDNNKNDPNVSLPRDKRHVATKEPVEEPVCVKSSAYVTTPANVEEHATKLARVGISVTKVTDDPINLKSEDKSSGKKKPVQHPPRRGRSSLKRHEEDETSEKKMKLSSALQPLEPVADVKSPQSVISVDLNTEDPIGIEDDSSSDAVIVEEDPLADVGKDQDTKKKPKDEDKPAISLSTFSLDFSESSTVEPKPSALRSLRKRGRERSLENLDTVTQTAGATSGSKRIKMRGRRSVDTRLRKSVEEQKKQELISSDDDSKVEQPQQSEEDDGDDDGKTEKISKVKAVRGNVAGKTIEEVKKSEEKATGVSSDADAEASQADTEPPQKKKEKKGKNKRLLSNLGINLDQVEIDGQDAPSLGVRQSRRIAQLKIREEAERRKLDDELVCEAQEMIGKKKKKKSDDKDYRTSGERKKAKTTGTVVLEEDDTTEADSNDSKKKKKKKRKHKLFDEHNPWRSSSDDSSSNVEEEEEEEIAEESDDHLLQYVSDHEFSPESDLEGDGDWMPLKRARTVKKESDVEDEVDDYPCQKCGKSDHPEWILLCDSCDNGWHCSCLRPPLLVIPEGDWFCPPCQHFNLLKKLQDKLVDYDKKLNKKEIEDRRKQRLAYVGISLNNVLPTKEPGDPTSHKKRADRKKTDKAKAKVRSRDGGDTDGDEKDEDDDVRDSPNRSSSDESGSSSGSASQSESDSDEPIYQLRQRRQAHSYRFNDYDDLINSAIQDEMEAVKGAGNLGKGKDISTIVNAEKEEKQGGAGEGGGGGGVEKSAVSADAEKEDKATTEASKVEVRVEEEPKKEYSDDDEPIGVKKRQLSKKKHRKLNALDISSADEDGDSDEDFKGTSSDSEDEFDEDLGSDDSEFNSGRRRRNDPVRRSTRARTSRYDADFIDDGDSDDEDEAPKRKKKRSIWDESEEESEESDRSWGRRKRKPATNRRKPAAPAISSSKKKKSKKKKKKDDDDSDAEVYRKKKPKIKFGIDDDGGANTRRTRGKKINYIDALGSDSDDDRVKRAPPRIEDSEEEYVANEEEEEIDEDDKISEDEEEENGEVGNENHDASKDAKDKKEKKSSKEGQVHIQSFSDPSFTRPLPEVVPPRIYNAQPMARAKTVAPELNPIEQINKNVEEMDENEMEKMMEEEEYANKQLQLVAQQIEKEKRRKEMEVSSKMAAVAPTVPEVSTPKKRGRKPKNQQPPPPPPQQSHFQFTPSIQDPIVDTVIESNDNNDELSEPPGVSLPMFMGDEEPKKRRGRMSGSVVKRTDEPLGMPHPATESNIEIAAPPQPFSQSQPTPSVITRMLQTKPGQPGYPVGTIRPKLFASMTERGAEEEPVGHQAPPPIPPAHLSPGAQYVPGGMRPQLSSPYRQHPINSHYPRPSPPLHPIRTPVPPAHIYHSHRPLDPSPSGGGTIDHPHPSGGRVASPSSPGGGGVVGVAKNGTPPPPAYARPPPMGVRLPPMGATPPPPRHVPLAPPPSHLHPPPVRGPPPAPPTMPTPYMPPGYYAGGQFGPMGGVPDEGGYQPYPSEFDVGQQGGGGGGDGKFEEEPASSVSGGGEFVGLVSYFSSQREDDLES